MRRIECYVNNTYVHLNCLKLSKKIKDVNPELLSGLDTISVEDRERVIEKLTSLQSKGKNKGKKSKTA